MAECKLQQLAEGVWIIPDVLSPDECYDQVARAEALGFEAASVRTTGGPQMLPGVRNNDRVVARDPGLARLLWDRLTGVLPEVDGEPANGLWDEFRYYRYEPGQRFKRHRDGIVRVEDGRASRLSFLVYLNEGAEGGETCFGEAESDAFKVSPIAGTALIFRHELWHEGAPVRSGRKYVIRTDVLFGPPADS